MDKGFTYQQARAVLAHTAHKHYSRRELVSRLHLVDPSAQVADKQSALSVAYMIAWRLLPAERKQ